MFSRKAREPCRWWSNLGPVHGSKTILTISVTFLCNIVMRQIKNIYIKLTIPVTSVHAFRSSFRSLSLLVKELTSSRSISKKLSPSRSASWICQKEKWTSRIFTQAKNNNYGPITRKRRRQGESSRLPSNCSLISPRPLPSRNSTTSLIVEFLEIAISSTVDIARFDKLKSLCLHQNEPFGFKRPTDKYCLWPRPPKSFYLLLTGVSDCDTLP